MIFSRKQQSQKTKTPLKLKEKTKRNQLTKNFNGNVTKVNYIHSVFFVCKIISKAKLTNASRVTIKRSLPLHQPIFILVIYRFFFIGALVDENQPATSEGNQTDYASFVNKSPLLRGVSNVVFTLLLLLLLFTH